VRRHRGAEGEGVLAAYGEGEDVARADEVRVWVEGPFERDRLAVERRGEGAPLEQARERAAVLLEDLRRALGREERYDGDEEGEQSGAGAQGIGHPVRGA